MANDLSHSKSGRIDYSKGFPNNILVFESLPDPRNGPSTKHYFGEIIFISLAAMLSGMDTCADFVRFAKGREQWLRYWLKLPNGIPCANTFLRLFATIDAEAFYSCLREFVLLQCPQLADKLIALDGKALRGSRKNSSNTVQMVSAWIAQEGLTLAQQAVDSKSNEITVIPKILRQLDIKGAIISLDAMGTQRSIAEEIQEQGADYLLALKGNQETIHQAAIDLFDTPETRIHSTHTTVDKGHGRIEKRTATVIESKGQLVEEMASKWVGLSSLVRVDTETLLAKGKTRSESRYYLSSMTRDAKTQLGYTRAHWSIENQCHWVLDVVFNEDGCRARSGNASANLSTLRRVALNLLKHDKVKPKEPLRGKRIIAVLDPHYLEKLMGLS